MSKRDAKHPAQLTVTAIGDDEDRWFDATITADVVDKQGERLDPHGFTLKEYRDILQAPIIDTHSNITVGRFDPDSLRYDEVKDPATGAMVNAIVGRGRIFAGDDEHEEYPVWRQVWDHIKGHHGQGKPAALSIGGDPDPEVGKQVVCKNGSCHILVPKVYWHETSIVRDERGGANPLASVSHINAMAKGNPRFGSAILKFGVVMEKVGLADTPEHLQGQPKILTRTRTPLENVSAPQKLDPRGKPVIHRRLEAAKPQQVKPQATPGSSASPVAQAQGEAGESVGKPLPPKPYDPSEDPESIYTARTRGRELPEGVERKPTQYATQRPPRESRSQVYHLVTRAQQARESFQAQPKDPQRAAEAKRTWDAAMAQLREQLANEPDPTSREVVERTMKELGPERTAYSEADLFGMDREADEAMGRYRAYYTQRDKPADVPPIGRLAGTRYYKGDAPIAKEAGGALGSTHAVPVGGDEWATDPDTPRAARPTESEVEVAGDENLSRLPGTLHYRVGEYAKALSQLLKVRRVIQGGAAPPKPVTKPTPIVQTQAAHREWQGKNEQQQAQRQKKDKLNVGRMWRDPAQRAKLQQWALGDPATRGPVPLQPEEPPKRPRKPLIEPRLPREPGPPQVYESAPPGTRTERTPSVRSGIEERQRLGEARQLAQDPKARAAAVAALRQTPGEEPSAESSPTAASLKPRFMNPKEERDVPLPETQARRTLEPGKRPPPQKWTDPRTGRAMEVQQPRELVSGVGPNPAVPEALRQPGKEGLREAVEKPRYFGEAPASTTLEPGLAYPQQARGGVDQREDYAVRRSPAYSGDPQGGAYVETEPALEPTVRAPFGGARAEVDVNAAEERAKQAGAWDAATQVLEGKRSQLEDISKRILAGDTSAGEELRSIYQDAQAGLVPALRDVPARARRRLVSQLTQRMVQAMGIELPGPGEDRSQRRPTVSETERAVLDEPPIAPTAPANPRPAVIGGVSDPRYAEAYDTIQPEDAQAVGGVIQGLPELEARDLASGDIRTIGEWLMGQGSTSAALHNLNSAAYYLAREGDEAGSRRASRIASFISEAMAGPSAFDVVFDKLRQGREAGPIGGAARQEQQDIRESPASTRESRLAGEHAQRLLPLARRIRNDDGEVTGAEEIEPGSFDDFLSRQDVGGTTVTPGEVEVREPLLPGMQDFTDNPRKVKGWLDTPLPKGGSLRTGREETLKDYFFNLKAKVEDSTTDPALRRDFNEWAKRALDAIGEARLKDEMAKVEAMEGRKQSATAAFNQRQYSKRQSNMSELGLPSPYRADQLAQWLQAPTSILDDAIYLLRVRAPRDPRLKEVANLLEEAVRRKDPEYYAREPAELAKAREASMLSSLAAPRPGQPYDIPPETFQGGPEQTPEPEEKPAKVLRKSLAPIEVMHRAW